MLLAAPASMKTEARCVMLLDDASRRRSVQLGAMSPLMSLTWTSLRTRECCLPEGKHAEQIAQPYDVFR
jgi:hypothetical protein